MKNLLKLTLPAQTKLSVDLGTYPDANPNGVESAADAIEAALVLELEAMKASLVTPLAARITTLEADLLSCRGVFADQIISLQTLSGVLKADDEEKIKEARAYLLGAENVETDHGLPMVRLLAEFNRLLTLGANAPGVQTSNHQPDNPAGTPAANPFFPTAVPVAAPATQAVRPGTASA